jgi:hypothetical protein
MNKLDPEAVVRQYIAAKDNHRWDEVVSLLDPEYTSTDPAIPQPVKGIEAVSQFFPMLEHITMTTEILMMASKGDDVAAELAVTCTFEKPSDSTATPPSSPSIVVKMAKFYKVNSNGLLVDEREYSNPAAKSALLGSEAAAQFESLGEEAATNFRTSSGDETTHCDVPGQSPTGR